MVFEILSGLKTGLGLANVAAQVGTSVAFGAPVQQVIPNIDLNPAAQTLKDLNAIRERQVLQANIAAQEEKAQQTLVGKITQNIFDLASTQQSIAQAKADGEPLEPLTAQQIKAIQFQGTGITGYAGGEEITTTTTPNLDDLMRSSDLATQEKEYRELSTSTREVIRDIKEVYTTYEKQIMMPEQQQESKGMDWTTALIIGAVAIGGAVVLSAILKR